MTQIKVGQIWQNKSNPNHTAMLIECIENATKNFYSYRFYCQEATENDIKDNWTLIKDVDPTEYCSRVGCDNAATQIWNDIDICDSCMSDLCRPEIDWSKAPPGCVGHANDEKGRGIWFFNKAEVFNAGWRTLGYLVDPDIKISRKSNINTDGNGWRESWQPAPVPVECCSVETRDERIILLSEAILADAEEIKWLIK